MFSIVVAKAHNNVIGTKNRIPWRVRSDLVHLKNLTKDQVVILGRGSYDSMVWYYDKSGRPMPGRLYIVVTRDKSYTPARQNAVTAHSVDEALAAARQHLNNEDEAFIIGGAQLYEQMLPYADRLYITEIDAKLPGDAYFPALNPKEWHEVAREPHQADEKNEFDYSFVTYERA